MWWFCSHQRVVLGLVSAELVTKLYEAAVKKVPLSEEYHSHLFMAYARVGEYKKMQQVWPPPPMRSYTVYFNYSSFIDFDSTLNLNQSAFFFFSGRNGSLQDRPQEPILLLVCNEFGDAGQCRLPSHLTYANVRQHCWLFIVLTHVCVCVCVQAISAQDEKLAQTMFLPLAERMVEKMVKEEKIEAEAEVRNWQFCYQ